MKTSIEMQLKITDRMRSNIEGGNYLLNGIEYFSELEEEWVRVVTFKNSDFATYKHRVKPETITINGVEIPKPLDVSEISPGGHYYFMPCLNVNLCTAIDGYNGQKFEYKHLYATKEQAIEASKLLFGIK